MLRPNTIMAPPADDGRVQRKRCRAIAIAGAERAADGGGDAAAHGARRHHLRQHGEGKDQRDRGQRLDSKPADIGRLGHRDQGAAEHGDRIGKRKPQQRRQDRRHQQAVDAHADRARAERGINGHASPDIQASADRQ